MEKIQSAIAKARAERDSQSSDRAISPPKGVGTAKAQATGAQGTSGIVAAWKALPSLNLDPSLMKRNRIVTLEAGSDAMGIDMMRTRALQQMRDNNWRRLAITSPTAGCGKSTIAVNLALSLQRQPNLRIALMEMDLRRPSLAKMVGVEHGISFASVLEGSHPFEDNAVRYGSNLAISTIVKPMRDAAELLNGPSVPSALADIEARYEPDMMLFDAPPMLVTDDMMAFARHVDCVLLVAGAETTTIKEVDLCERELATQTNVMGVVLNKCRYMGPEYGYGYY